MYLAYFGSATLHSAVKDFVILGIARRADETQILQPGLYCVSASILEGVFDRPRGPWCRSFEQSWERTRSYMTAHEQSPDETAAAALIDAVTADRDELLLRSGSRAVTSHARVVQAFNLLQAARLKAALRGRTPDVAIGGSILCFRLSQADIDTAVLGPPAELADQSWFEREGYGTESELARMGNVRLATGDLTGAHGIFARMTALYPGDPRAWQGLAEANAALGRSHEAVRARREAERLIGALEKAGEP